MSSTWRTDVTGSTMAEVERAALAEFVRFFGARATPTLHEEMTLDIRVHSFTRDGHGQVCSRLYEAEVTVWL